MIMNPDEIKSLESVYLEKMKDLKHKVDVFGIPRPESLTERLVADFHRAEGACEALGKILFIINEEQKNAP